MKTVRYSSPVNASEAALRFVVLEDNGNRVLIRCTTPITEGGTLYSTETVMKGDVCES